MKKKSKKEIIRQCTSCGHTHYRDNTATAFVEIGTGNYSCFFELATRVGETGTEELTIKEPFNKIRLYGCPKCKRVFFEGCPV